LVRNGADCGLDMRRVWTSQQCTGMMPHPHHPDKTVPYQGHYATSASPSAFDNDDCVPEHSPLGALCCADIVGTAPVSPPSPPAHPPRHPHHHAKPPSTPHHHHHDADASGEQGSNSSNYAGLAIFGIVILAIAGCCCWLRAKNRRLLEQQQQKARNAGGSSDVTKIASAVKRAGGRAKHHKLRDESALDERESIELTEPALEQFNTAHVSPPQASGAGPSCEVGLRSAETRGGVTSI